MTKKKYITTAIPYVNAKPHVGHAMDYVLADIWARYHRQYGADVKFQVGADEHGSKIANKASEAGQDPQIFADINCAHLVDFIKAMNVQYTDFIRTTDPHHIQTAQYIWQKLAPYIYKGQYQGWYCVGCESFVTDKEATANNGVCPDHNQSYQRLSEENYYFKLSAFTEPIKQAIETGKFQIVPEFRKKEIQSLLNSGLQDISISRPTKTLGWGIPVPGDDTQVMYVWVDALSNYLSVLGYPDNEQWKDYWPADIQIVGKDILRFHAAIWPAMLLALDLSLPKVLLVHGHINVGGTKMSKTIGNVVDPMEVVQNYGVDAFRYYFARHVPTQDDGDFTWEKFENAYNNELGNELGNLVQRVAVMVKNYQAGVVGDVIRAEHDSGAYHDAMRSLNFDRALDEVWLEIRSLNQYLENVKPWEVAKARQTDSDAESHLAEILGHAVGSLGQIADLLQPFLPGSAAIIAKVFEGGVISPYQGVLFPKKYLHTTAPTRSSKT